MSMKRLALIAAVSFSHHTSQTTTTSTTPTAAATAGGTLWIKEEVTASSSLLLNLPTRGTTPTTTTPTDDGNLNLNAAGIGKSASALGADSAGGEVGGGDGGGRSNINTGTSFFSKDLSALEVGAGGGSGLYQGHQAMRPGATLHGNVNVLLGGAMLSVVITVVCVVCYCCHRNIKKRSESIYRQQRWIDNAAGPINMDVYSVEQCYDASRLYTESTEPTSTTLHHSGPPPSYDSVLAMDDFQTRPSPPPKYQQASRKSSRKCCTIARQAALALNTTCNISNCRKHHQHPNHHYRHHHFRDVSMPSSCESCSCLHALSTQQFEQERSHLNPTIHTDDGNNISANCCKPVPTEIDSLNNNVQASNSSVRAGEVIKPSLPECHLCQLCGKLQQYSTSVTTAAAAVSLHQELTSISADIENGNGNHRPVMCSCDEDTLQPAFNYSNGNDGSPLSHCPEEAGKMQLDSMNNELGILAGDSQSTTDIGRPDPKEEPVQCRHHQQGNNNHHQPANHQSEHSHQQREQYHSSSLPVQQLQNLTATLDTFNENGIIRMDMSQIIDRTGLPTYEAAIKLESSGYV